MGDHKHKKDSKKSSSKREHSSHSKHGDHKKHKKISSSSKRRDESKEIDYNDASLWVEAPGTTEIMPAEHLRNHQQADRAGEEQKQPTTETLPQQEEARHGWMLDGGLDFGSMGTARVREQDKPKPNPDMPVVSERELNQNLVKGIKFDDYPEEKKTAIKFGDAGSNWRMMKLKRTKEQAEDEGRSLREVGIEKYGSVDKFEEALAERDYLDNKRGGRREDVRGSRREDDRGSRREDDRRSRKEDDRGSRREDDRGSRRREDDQSNTKRRDEDDRNNSSRREDQRRYMFTDTDSQQKAFKRPEPAKTQPSQLRPTPSPTPIIQSVIPQTPSLTRDELNKLNAKLVKAKLMGSSNLEALEKEYQIQLERFEQGNSNVSVLPSLDSQGRLYDYTLKQGSEETLKGKRKYEGTHDKVTGERIKYGTSDDTLSLAEMVRQERGGSRSMNMDMEFANRIVADASFENNLDYMDDKADIMASKKGATEEQKMRRAVTDYRRTQEALGKCKLCYQEGNPPQIAMISLGTTCYLALPNQQELTPGSCLIVPIQHVTSTLDCDDDVWTEIRNFQKCLLKMFHAQGKGVIFMETVTSVRSQRHTAIECIPIPYGVYEDAPAYFKEAILGSGEEWSQHKKLIDTSIRGFRHSLVPNLPYFHVWCGLDKGYGHVIEGQGFKYWFGKEVLAGMLDLGPELWRKPKYYHPAENHQRQQAFLKDWEKWDWTAAL